MAKRLTKPKSVREDPYRNQKWNEIVRGREFQSSDVPALTLLVQWYQIIDQCIDDLTVSPGRVRVAYENDMGDVRAMPQTATMKQASAEIRALNKQLGINDGRDSEVGDANGGNGGIDVLKLIQSNRQDRRSRATA